METQQILGKVYRTSSVIIAASLFLICCFFGWQTEMIIMVLAYSLVISAPAVISLNAICWVLKRIQLPLAFAWMLLLAMIPLLVLVPAMLLVNALPGDTAFLLLLGMISAYAGIFGNGESIAQLFKSLL